MKVASEIPERIRAVRERVRLSCERCSRHLEDITIVAVSKGVSVEHIGTAFREGILDFGENRYQEAESKVRLARGLGIKWHFIGRIQTNKLRRILESFHFIQSLDRMEVLSRANEILQASGTVKEVLLQVNISGEKAKAGFTYEEIRSFFEEKQPLNYPQLKIRGLMGIGPLTNEVSGVRRMFKDLRACFDRIKADYPPLDTLSMGMTQDFEVAIEEGANMVRIGTALFGERG